MKKGDNGWANMGHMKRALCRGIFGGSEPEKVVSHHPNYEGDSNKRNKECIKERWCTHLGDG
jgi:hypothetical protein